MRTRVLFVVAIQRVPSLWRVIAVVDMVGKRVVRGVDWSEQLDKLQGGIYFLSLSPATTVRIDKGG